MSSSMWLLKFECEVFIFFPRNFISSMVLEFWVKTPSTKRILSSLIPTNLRIWPMCVQLDLDEMLIPKRLLLLVGTFRNFVKLFCRLPQCQFLLWFWRYIYCNFVKLFWRWRNVLPIYIYQSDLQKKKNTLSQKIWGTLDSPQK
jgi:hypothetical protein